MNGINILLSNEPQKSETLIPLECYKNLNKLPKEGARLIVIDTHMPDWFEGFVTLRNTLNYYLTPIFYLNEPAPKYWKLFDGAFDDGILTKADTINERITLIANSKLQHLDNEELRLMCYLFSRPNTLLEGYYDANSPFGYRYPHLELLFNQPKANFFPLLDEWVSQKLLIKSEWVDEMQLCPHCQSALLNFKNACPNCHSIKIKPQVFIHCYSCGNVAPMDEVYHHDQLVCSKCNAALRHIGIDYDRPLEDKLCLECNSHFLDATAISFCMVCLKSCMPDELVSKQLFHYQLSPHGEFWVRGLEERLSNQLDNFFTLIDFETFLTLMNWQLELATRYTPIHFSLLALAVNNEQALVEEKGIVTAETIISQFFKEARQLFRDSDIISRHEGTVYFILPMASKENTDMLIQRLRAFIQKQLDNSALNIQVSLSALASEEIIPLKLKGKQLLIELANRMTSYG